MIVCSFLILEYTQPLVVYCDFYNDSIVLEISAGILNITHILIA